MADDRAVTAELEAAIERSLGDALRFLQSLDNIAGPSDERSLIQLQTLVSLYTLRNWVLPEHIVALRKTLYPPFNSCQQLANIRTDEVLARFNAERSANVAQRGFMPGPSISEGPSKA